MKIICIGRNYQDHIDGLKNKTPTEPVLFIKPDSAVLKDKTKFIIPHFSQQIQHELELIVQFNALGKHIEPKFAHKYFDKISLGIDFTARDLQDELKKQNLPWEKAKSFDRSAVVGKWIDKSKFDDIQNLDFKLLKNNQVIQQSNSSKMLWKIDQLISYASSFFTIKIGDILFTGSPSGVGNVGSGDVLIGILQNREVFNVRVK